MANVRRLKKTAQIFRDVPLDVAQADGASEHAATRCLDPTTGCSHLYPVEHLDSSRRTLHLDGNAVQQSGRASLSGSETELT
jgi:hypothetical protein